MSDQQKYREIKFLNAILRSIRNVNQMIVREKDPEILIKEACKILIETDGFFTSWIRISDGNGKNEYFAESGIGNTFSKLKKRYVERKKINCLKRPAGTGSVIKIKNPEKECGDCPLVGIYQRRGVIGTDISFNEKVYGNITVSFDAEYLNRIEVENLIKEISSDIGFALHDIEITIAANEEMRKAQNYLDIASVMIVVLDENGQVTLINRKGLEILGYDNDSEVIGKNWFENFIPEESKEEVYSVFQKILSGDLKETENRENPVRSKDGSIKLIEWHNSFIKDKKGKIINTISSGLDITAKIEKEKEILMNKYRLKMILSILQHKTVLINDFLDFALNRVIAFTNSFVGYIYHYNEKDRQFVLNSWSKVVMDECKIKEKQTVYELDKTGIWGEAVRQRKAIIVNNFQEPHPLKRGYPEGHVDLFRFMTIPVIVGREIVAVVGVGNSESDYTEKDVEQLTLLMSAVWKEVLRKEAEKKLKDHKENLEEIVKRRTEEIEKINAELAERNSDLERFFKATLERENRIKELRDRVDELEEELKKKNRS